MAAVVEGLGPWGISNRWRFLGGALLLMGAGTLGTIAAFIRWLPCGDTSDQGTCTYSGELADLPFHWFFVMLGIADLLLAAGVVLIVKHHVHRILISVLALGIASSATFALFFGLGVQALRGPMVWFLGFGWMLVLPFIAVIIAIVMHRTWEYAGNYWALLPILALVLGSGFGEYFLLQLVFNAVDTPRGSDGLRFMFVLVIGVVMCGFLIANRLGVTVSNRKSAS